MLCYRSENIDVVRGGDGDIVVREKYIPMEADVEPTFLNPETVHNRQNEEDDRLSMITDFNKGTDIWQVITYNTEHESEIVLAEFDHEKDARAYIRPYINRLCDVRDMGGRGDDVFIRGVHRPEIPRNPEGTIDWTESSIFPRGEQVKIHPVRE